MCGGGGESDDPLTPPPLPGYGPESAPSSESSLLLHQNLLSLLLHQNLLSLILHQNLLSLILHQNLLSLLLHQNLLSLLPHQNLLSLRLHQNLLGSFIRIFFLCSFIRIFFRRQTRSQTFVYVCVLGGWGGSNWSNFGTFYDYAWINL